MKLKTLFIFLITLLLFSTPAFSKQKSLKSATMDMMRGSYVRLFECFGAIPFCKSVEDCIQNSDANEVLKNPDVASGKITVADLETCTQAFRKISCAELKKTPPQECTKVPPFKD